jgi:putative two-component system response regulator
MLANGLGLSEAEVERIRQAAPLHDIGKLSISDAVLLKPGKLSDAEFEQIKGHTAAGADILSGSSSEILGLAQEIALTHHEWWNGNGYPEGLKGDEIPLSGRLVALADVFDALTHTRPYKEAWSPADAAAEVRRLSGEQFDPRVVDAFEGLDPHQLVGPLES